jgi:hypothetical protein
MTKKTRIILYIDEVALFAEAVESLPVEYRNRSTMLELFDDKNPDSDSTIRVVVTNEELLPMIFYPGRLPGPWEVIKLNAKPGIGYH